MVVADGLFPEAEYRDRARRVRTRMAQREVDTLYVTSPPNIAYLTGYDSVWYDPRSPLGVALRVDSDTLVFCDSADHEQRAAELFADEIALFGRERSPEATREPVRAVVAALKSRGWHRGTVGLERWSWTPSAVVVQQLADLLGDAAATVVDASWTVDHVALVKSPREIECVRWAAAIADRALAEVVELMRPGVSELELAAAVDAIKAREGGEQAAIRTMVKSGPRVTRFHAPATRRRIERGDLVTVDTCGSYRRYHADIARTFALGDHPRARSILDQTARSIAEVQRTVRPGEPTQRVQDVANGVIEAAGLSDYVWWVGGYALGASVQPSWVGHVYLADDEGFEAGTLVPGFVTNYENLLSDPREGWTALYVDTLLVGEDGIEILSSLNRGLTVVE